MSPMAGAGLRLHQRPLGNCVSRSPRLAGMPVGYIYIVDDDQAVRASLSALFEANGYESGGLSSAQEFLMAPPALDPGCLVADIRMPGMDGLEMQRRLIERGLPFPVIVITGHGDVPLAVGAMKAGALDFIEKPFAPDTILNRSKNALGNPSTRQQPDALSAKIGRA